MARTVSVPTDGRASPRAPKRLLALRADDFLVAQLRQGNEAAFEVLYERHVPGILSFCRHMLGSLDEAEDAVQHSFAAAHRALLRDDREIRVKPWLYKIARNRCFSMLRARREQPDDTLDASTEGLSDEVERRADLRELVADLQDLPDDQRAALVLSELRDLSHADVAEALGCQVANVKGLVFRARSGLIERREARGATCEEIQTELATARGGALRRGKLRHHLRTCGACSDYLGQVRAQRKMLGMILPVVPSLGLKDCVLAAVGIGGGASGGGGAAAGGGLLATALPGAGATVAKVAVVGALVGGAGVAGEAVVDGKGAAPAAPSAVVPAGPAGAAGSGSAFTPIDSVEADEERSPADERLAAREEREKRGKARDRDRAKRKSKKWHAAPPAHARALGLQKLKKAKAVDAPKVKSPSRGGRSQEAPRVRPELPVKPPRAPKQKVLAAPTPTPEVEPEPKPKPLPQDRSRRPDPIP